MIRETVAREAGADAPAEFAFSPLMIPGVVRVADLLMVAVAAAAASLLTEAAITPGYEAVCAIFVAFAHLFLGERALLFALPAVMRPIKRADDVALAIGTSLMLFLSVAFALEAVEEYPRAWVLTFGGLAIGGAVAARILLYQALRALARLRMVGRSMVVLGVGEQSRRFLRRYQRSDPLFTVIVGVFHGEGETLPASVEGFPVLGGVEALMAAARARRIDDIVIAMPWNADRDVTGIVEQLKELPVNVYLSTDLVGYELAFTPAMGAFADLPLFEVVQRPISGWASALKMIEDYVLATLLLILISPLMALVAIAIKLDTRGPVFFRQARLGFNNREFFIYKFRSMHHGDVPEAVVRQATKGDPRVTRVGRFIRASSIDELPQLLNVLDGTMSLVGPRPHAVSHNEEYGRQIRGYFARHKVKPGITGWAQVNGLRGETEALDKMAARIQHDVYYAENWSILFDLRILVTTVLVVLFQRSAY